MDKFSKPFVSREKYEIHHLPRGIHQVHKDYGLWIIGYGHAVTRIDSYAYCAKRYFEYYSISHLLVGEGKVWLHPNKEYEMQAGQCVIISPQTPNRYGGINGHEYEEDAIRFVGPVADMLFKSGVIRDGVFELGQARRLLPIAKLVNDPARDSQINANIALQRLLVDIYNHHRQKAVIKTDYIIDKLIDMLKEQLDRWWTVNEMAEYCSLSDDQFRRLFTKRTGMLPKLYLDRLKIHQASELLMSNRLKISEIADSLGYVDQYHFSRRFKKLTGFSPRNYRQAFSLDT